MARGLGPSHRGQLRLGRSWGLVVGIRLDENVLSNSPN